ncbi:hypothetical protein SPFM12_00225 [Salmonella phage SPFM12]|nr:hypothetical protein SPFM12_00225 [Salmonella phage SPFM12]
MINDRRFTLSFPAQILPPQNDNSVLPIADKNEVFPMMQVGPYITFNSYIPLRACLRHSVISSDEGMSNNVFNVFRFALIGESRDPEYTVGTYPEYVQRILPEHFAADDYDANAYFLAQKLAVNVIPGDVTFLHCVTTAPISAALAGQYGFGVQSKKDLAIEDKGGLGYHLLDFVMASTLDKTVAVIYTADKPTKLWDRLVKVLPQSGEVHFRMTGQTVLDIDAYEAANFTHLV